MRRPRLDSDCCLQVAPNWIWSANVQEQPKVMHINLSDNAIGPSALKRLARGLSKVSNASNENKCPVDGRRQETGVGWDAISSKYPYYKRVNEGKERDGVRTICYSVTS